MVLYSLMLSHYLVMKEVNGNASVPWASVCFSLVRNAGLLLYCHWLCSLLTEFLHGAFVLSPQVQNKWMLKVLLQHAMQKTREYIYDLKNWEVLLIWTKSNCFWFFLSQISDWSFYLNRIFVLSSSLVRKRLSLWKCFSLRRKALKSNIKSV